MMDAERFERFVERIPFMGCWIWTGCVTNGNYGRFGIKGSSVLAHRFAAQMAGKLVNHKWSGNWSGRDFVCHSCDNPLCVNPDHLFVASHMDNMVDRFTKRGVPNAQGFKNPNCKMSKSDLRKIRSLSMRGESPSRIAAILSCPLSRVENVVYKRTFKGV